jgi:hypothetical protein
VTIDTVTAGPSLPARILHNWFTRFIIMFVVLTAVYAASQIIPNSLAKSHAREMKDWFVLADAVIGVPLVLIVYALLTRWLERHWPTDIPARSAIPQIVIGSIVGFVLFSTVITVLVYAGHGSVALPAAFIFPLAALALSIISGVAEEVIFRGAMFRIVEGRFGTLIAMLVSAAFFGAIHGGNPGATVVSSVAIALEAGLMLALAYTATRTLWVAVGLHFAWNFTEGGIFTTQVSGGKVPGILKTTLTGPDIITGGSFGPEASVIAVGVCLVGALLFLIVTLRRDNWKPLTIRKPA